MSIHASSGILIHKLTQIYRHTGSGCVRILRVMCLLQKCYPDINLGGNCREFFLNMAHKENGKLSASYVFICSQPMSEVTKTHPQFSILSGLGPFKYVNTSIHICWCPLTSLCLERAFSSVFISHIEKLMSFPQPSSKQTQKSQIDGVRILPDGADGQRWLSLAATKHCMTSRSWSNWH